MSNSEAERHADLKIWLEERQITLQYLADLMGVSRTFVSVMLHRETMPPKRHKQLIALGVPEELLPKPFTGAHGRPCASPLLHPVQMPAQETPLS